MPVPLSRVGRQVGKQVGLAVVVVPGQLPGRAVDVDATVPARLPALDLRTLRAAWVDTGEQGHQLIALAVGRIDGHLAFHGLNVRRASKASSGALQSPSNLIARSSTVSHAAGFSCANSNVT